MGALAYQQISEPVFERRGVAELTRMAFNGEDLTPLANELLIASANNPGDAGVLMDLAMVEQLRGNLEAGLQYQINALQISPLFTVAPDRNTRTRVLVIAAPIRMGGNTPIEFLLENSDIEVVTLFIAPGLPLPEVLPDHDIAFVAAPGDSDDTRQFLEEIDRRLPDLPRPALNSPAAIAELDRDRLCELLADRPGIVSPLSIRCSRKTVQDIAEGKAEIDGLYPFVIRPVGSHAGRGLERMQFREEILPYLLSQDADEFFVTQYVDYRSEDGLYRKYRIVFIAGQPYACHMAIAEHWKLWYMNAEMEKSRFKLVEEQEFMTCFNEDFGVKHQTALQQIAERVGLEYFGIDCAETRDGELVVFEADNSLIVHDMDPKETFPYKSEQMQKVFKAFQEMLHTGANALR